MGGGDGWPPDQLFSSTGHGYGFDDIVLLPGGRAVSSSTKFNTAISRNVKLLLPVVCGPSDIIVEEKMAVAVALQGGIGIIHRDQSIEEQVAMVKRVKQHQNGFVLDVYTAAPHHSVADARKIQEAHGCNSIPITDNGQVGGKVKGLVTARDLLNAPDGTTRLDKIMTRNVQCAKEPITFGQASQLMQESKNGKIMLVNDESELLSMLCRGDLKKLAHYPLAARDSARQLLVAASVSAEEFEEWKRMEVHKGKTVRSDVFDPRTQELIRAGVDVLCLDTCCGVGEHTISFVKQAKDMNKAGSDSMCPDIVAGPVNSWKQAQQLCEAGVDGLRVGGKATKGHAEATTVYEIARLVRAHGYAIPVIADGQVENSSQLLKAVCVGASAVVIDKMVQGTEEVPGEHLFREGIRVRQRTYPSSIPGGRGYHCSDLGVVQFIRLVQQRLSSPKGQSPS